MFSEASSQYTETGSITYQVYARRKTRVTRGGSPGSSSRCESLHEAITDSKVLSFVVNPSGKQVGEYQIEDGFSLKTMHDAVRESRRVVQEQHGDVYDHLGSVPPEWTQLDKHDEETQHEQHKNDDVLWVNNVCDLYFAKVNMAACQVRKSASGYGEILQEVCNALAQDTDLRDFFVQYDPERPNWGVTCLAWCIHLSVRGDDFRRKRLTLGLIEGLGKYIRVSAERQQEEGTEMSLNVTTDSAISSLQPSSTIGEAVPARSGVMLNTAMVNDDPLKAWLSIVANEFKQTNAAKNLRGIPSKGDDPTKEAVYQLLSHKDDDRREPFSGEYEDGPDTREIIIMAYAIRSGSKIFPVSEKSKHEALSLAQSSAFETIGHRSGDCPLQSFVDH
ncbi:hypothetical protein FFLO_07065 [Filobasidium floriforme]|uniref:Uncharacterized protein n=1 Tax=Filobasidium floriforme TaxID=5210 RepID=A0A8K0JE70_9TREE|nr:uncharacterized protein HD553DRAFT_343814 [Filobasidium floriforme]KAG7527309.1 hypothetical protein FFLO_07065 [Filobasidium floriforme]KAH8081740.1 hypothetical protein HD553DRAFT_343814 [Filobasidium floriforme]